MLQGILFFLKNVKVTFTFVAFFSSLSLKVYQCPFIWSYNEV